MRLGVGFRPLRHGLRVFALLALCALWSCGRIGVLLLAATDAGVVPDAGPRPGDAGPRPDSSMPDPDAGGPYMGCDATTCECDGSSCMPDPTSPMACEDPSTVSPAAICGCGQIDTDDADGDGTPDCIDFCPLGRDQNEDATCACGPSQADADGDGTQNCMDRCPFDPNKVVPGMCGCGVADTDTDSDGVPNCVDACPANSNKSVVGMCGCDRSDLDSDLDGTPDCLDSCSGEDGVTYEPISDCGRGYCRTTNMPSMCVAGVETDCTPGMPLMAADTSCDGIDDDCDGNVDEDYLVTSHTCGQGVCSRMGALRCTAGMIVDECVPGTPTLPNDATCNAMDEDCDGKVDENYVSTPSSCDTGACASMGVIACVNGMVRDSCVPAPSQAMPDNNCNNIDDDCDTRIDEAFMSTSTSCGVGACRRTGSTSCVSGMTRNSCTPGNPSGTDTSCNNVDEDCDGRVDEGYVQTSSSCGRGICASTGTRRCQSGSVVDSCVQGTPRAGADDPAAPGNGLDDDCDGKIDENLPPCDTTPRTYEAGAYTLPIPGNCRRVTVRLWGGGGGGGQSVGVAGSGAEGGPGGYATANVLVQTPLQLFVGAGASNNCNTGGSNSGSSTYNGGAGGADTGGNGQGGTRGGTGGTPSTGYRGGDGYNGGGGGGQGSGGLGSSGNGGGGGAGTVMIVNGVVAALAGGGGGGGGGQSLSILGTLAASGGRGGSGCRANGQAPNANGGGGGGGGVCSGSTTQAGSDTTPAQSGDIPSGRARGGASNCGAGGAGYAIVTFSAS